MAEIDGRRPRVGRRAVALGGGRAAADWAESAPDVLASAHEWLAAALREEADAGRLAPWLAVGFGAGILLYFAAPSEPSLLAPGILVAVLVALAWASRERPFAFGLSLALISVAAGFTVGCVRGSLIAHPVLTRTTGTVTLQGYVEARDTTERSERVVLRVTGPSGRGPQLPDRVRVAFRRGAAPDVGSYIEARAQLRPLVGPVRPGGYDYALGTYFEGIGATGFALGRARVMPISEPLPWTVRARAFVDGMRRSLTDRIRALVPGETGGIAAALVTGERDAISPETNEAMRVSGLYHVLSISGLHMALVAGALFALIRGGLALVPMLALRRPIKKWAAIAALFGVSFYLVLSGAEVATQRSFIMIAIVLCGVLVDRPALTVRTLAAAAFGVLLLQPESLLNPSFQMSFAATLALVALYERYVPMIAAPPMPGGGAIAHFSERTLRWLLLGTAASLTAGIATAAYGAFHFHRLATYSVVANLLTMPLISLVIMPGALLAVFLLPFGYDVYGWKVMGWGIDGMMKVAQWVAALPGADGRFAAFGAGALLMATAGILLLALPATRIRLVGIPLLGLAFVLAVTAPRPDVLIDAEGEVVAVRGPDGRLTILDAASGRFIADNWLAADADRRKADKTTAAGFKCDDWGCVARLDNGSIVAVARRHEAFFDDCRQAALVITRLEAPSACQVPVIDRKTLAATGALSLRRIDGAWVEEAARPLYSDRPWYGRARPAEPNALSRLQGGARTPSAADARSTDPDDEMPPELSDAEGENGSQ
jgi:competence protein ComEC